MRLYKLRNIIKKYRLLNSISYRKEYSKAIPLLGRFKPVVKLNKKFHADYIKQYLKIKTKLI